MEFATTTLSGVSIGPPNDLIMEDDVKRAMPNHKVLYVVVPLVCAIVLIDRLGWHFGIRVAQTQWKVRTIEIQITVHSSINFGGSKVRALALHNAVLGRTIWERCFLGSNRINKQAWA